MIPALNQVLFFLSTLFGLQAGFVAEQTSLTIDFKTKTAVIEYLDVMTSTQTVEYAEEGLNKIDNAASFNESFPQIKLESKTFEKNDGKLNARITFSFENQDALLKLLRFNLTQYGEQTSSEELCYHLLPSENLMSSNGTETKKEDITILKWNTEVKEIRIELNQKENASELMGDLKSIAEYWKE